MAEVLNVTFRETRGKHNAKRLRKAGSIPGVLYGHGEKNVSLAVPADQLDMLVHHGSRLVKLAGAVSESAFIRDVQWDTWGTHVLHVDFTRVSEDEKVELQVSVELRGEAPGVRQGGVVEQLIHEVQLECPAGKIPEKIVVSVNDLELHDSVTVADLKLPAGAAVPGDQTVVVVQCVEPVEMPELEAAEAVSGEPEVIGAKEEEDAAGD
ncbi:MAG: 50S ribosomal protein L25 [Pirellulales bacterium]|nr:50S ribosomal protein L25 [Pirellulales bacterium]